MLATPQGQLATLPLGSVGPGDVPPVVQAVVYLAPPPATWTLGDVLSLTAIFTDTTTGLPVDPDTVTFTIRSPETTIIDSTPTRQTSGTYTLEQPASMTGDWHWGVTGSGGAAAAGDSVFVVAPAF